MAYRRREAACYPADVPKCRGPRPLPLAKDERPRPPRRARAGRWRALTLLGVHLAFAAHLAHWAWAGETLSPLEPSEAIAFARAGWVNAGLLFFAATLLGTALFGRWFCGWGCHVVALQDGARWLLLRAGLRPRPLRSRALALVPFLAAAWMFALPLLARGSLSVRSVELTTREFWRTFPAWPVALLTLAVCGGLSVLLLGSKGFCTYACPYGALYGLLDRLAPWRIRVGDACRQCGQCTAVCSSNVLVHAEVRDHGMVVDPGCMKCLDCVGSCPTGALRFGFGRPALVAPRGPRSGRPSAKGRGEEFLLALGFAAAFLALDGLYDRIPFLLALGAAGCLAWGLRTVWRIARRPSVKLLSWHLRRSGARTRAGHAFLVASALAFAGWAHSAGITWLAYRCRRVHDETAALHRSPHPWRAQLARPARLDAAWAERVARGIACGEAVRRYGLARWPSNSLRLAWLYLLAGREDEAEARAREALAGLPRNARARADLARLLLARERPAEAAALLEEARRLRPGDPEVLHALARAHALAGQGEEATQAYAALLGLRPDRWELWLEAGRFAAQRGRREEARAKLAEAARRAPADRAAQLALSEALLAAGLYAEAADRAQALLGRDPGDPIAHRLLGLAHRGRGERALALRHLRRAVQANGDPTAARALRELEAEGPPPSPGSR
ncbi:MAG: 4Fe-4S binding protein [Planctomycetota bacterium]|nr:MAG: 4Fe-4S binding protein [Planctomycetota bacterium]